MSKSRLFGYYEAADCLVFPSKVETWGLPITEFMETGKPMLLADLPYAHETAAGSKQTVFFPATDAVALKNEMKNIWNGDVKHFVEVPFKPLKSPKAASWHELFELLLNG